MFSPFAVRSLLVVSVLCLLPTDSTVAQSHASSSALHTTFEAVDSLRSHGHFQDALNRLNQLPSSHQDQVEVLWRKALMLSELGRGHRQTAPDDTTRARHRRASALADRALARDSTNAWAHLVNALTAGRLTLHTSGSTRIKHSRAVKHHTDRAIELDSTLAAAYHLRGRWCREVADLNFLKRTLVKAIYGGLPDASLDQAIRDLEQATMLEPKPYNHLELAKTYLVVERDSLAHHHLRRVLATSGSPFDAEHKKEAQMLLRELED